MTKPHVDLPAADIDWLFLKEQIALLRISGTNFFEYVRASSDFPPEFPHPISPRRKVRSRAQLLAWLDKKVSETAAARAAAAADDDSAGGDA